MSFNPPRYLGEFEEPPEIADNFSVCCPGIVLVPGSTYFDLLDEQLMELSTELKWFIKG